MSVNPFKINLNPEGSVDNIQCAYLGYLVSSNITGQDIQIYFNGEVVANAYNVDYCAIDNMIFVQLDWSDVISSPVLLLLANTEVTVTITGPFNVTDRDGNVIVYDVDRKGSAEVIKPGKKKK